jgi:general secretion pathway protein D
MRYKGLFTPQIDGQGVLQFIFHGGGNKHLPPFDLAYSFLMAQEDIQLNAAPSVITVNQTPATISIVDEISINNGAAPIDASNGTTVFEKTFARAQYGITIILTPTVHMPDKEMDGDDAQGFITLQTNITFDTPRANHDDRPTVNRRHIENEVRVLDGQTVIIGGLRKKSTIDLEDKVPFLGEIPGLGKLFGSTKLVDDSTEMFFFITPTIILNPEEQMECFLIEELKMRPGDLPEFLEKLVEAREKEKNRFLKNSMRMFYKS